MTQLLSSTQASAAFLALLLFAAWISSVPAAVGATESTDPVTERQMAMEGISERMKELSQMAKNPGSFSRERVEQLAQEIFQLLKLAQEQFRAQQTGNVSETWAKPEIWQQPEDFSKRFQSAQERARALVDIESASSLGPALRALGQSCKSCHEVYRRPKD
jgi:cytochrome c556